VHRDKETRRRVPSGRLAAVAAVALFATGLTAVGGTSVSVAASPKPVTIDMELVLTGVQFAVNATLGMDTAATNAGGVTINVNGPTSIDPTLAQSQVTTDIAQSPTGLGIDPFTPDLWGHALATAIAAVPNTLVMNDKPVISPSQLSSASVHTYVGISDADYASELASATIKTAGLSPSTKGTVLIGQCVSGSTGVLAERTTAYLSTIHKLLPKTTIVTFNSQVVQTMNTSAWTSELTAHPKAVLALGGCDQDGASLYLVKRKLHLHFATGGIDLTPQSLAGVANGTLADTLNDDYFVQGYVAATMLIDAARGKPFPQGWINTGYTLITKQNVAAITKANQSNAATVSYWLPKALAIVNHLSAHTQPLKAAWGGTND
jgi:ABC-type sugar transport system substrate-binding protein